MQRGLRYFALANVVLGGVALVGPLVTGSHETLLHIETGWLLGLVAFNWGHALLHLTLGGYGLVAVRHHEGALAFAWLAVVVFALTGLLGVLGEAGLLEQRTPEGPLRILGMAVDVPGHVIHLVLAAVALALVRGGQRAATGGGAPAGAEDGG